MVPHNLHVFSGLLKTALETCKCIPYALLFTGSLIHYFFGLSMFLRSTKRSSVKKKCPGTVIFVLTQFLDLNNCMSLELVLSLRTEEENAERAAVGGWAALEQLRQTVLWQSLLLLIPDIYTNSSATPHSKGGTHHSPFLALNARGDLSVPKVAQIIYTLEGNPSPCLLWREHCCGLCSRALKTH